MEVLGWFHASCSSRVRGLLDYLHDADTWTGVEMSHPHFLPREFQACFRAHAENCLYCRYEFVCRVHVELAQEYIAKKYFEYSLVPQ